MKLKLASLIFLMVFAGDSKLVYFTNPIYLDVVNQYVYVFDAEKQSVFTNLGTERSKFIKVYKCSPKGNIQFSIKDSTENLYVDGQYIEVQDLTKSTTPVVKLGRFKAAGGPNYFYKPTRDGDWIYRNKYKNILKVETYQAGRLLCTKNYPL